MQDVQCSCAKYGAVTARKNHGPLPGLQRKGLTANYGRRLVLQEVVMDGLSLTARPFLSEHLKFEGVDEFRFTQGRQEECRLNLGQQSGSDRLRVLAVERY